MDLLDRIGGACRCHRPHATARPGCGPPARPGGRVVAPRIRHLFISSGVGSTSILVTDYSGQTVASIPNEQGAIGLALSSDGSTVYAALADGDAVSAISTSTLTETARYATGANMDPVYVVYTSGRIWFGYTGSFPLAGIQLRRFLRDCKRAHTGQNYV
jgi:DNA-binding beta-propeller fold protein YncE